MCDNLLQPSPPSSDQPPTPPLPPGPLARPTQTTEAEASYFGTSSQKVIRMLINCATTKTKWSNAY